MNNDEKYKQFKYEQFIANQSQQAANAVTLPGQQSLSSRSVPYKESAETRRKSALWDKNQDIRSEDMPIDLRNKNQLQRDRFVYGDEAVRGRTSQVASIDEEMKQLQSGIKPSGGYLSPRARRLQAEMSGGTDMSIPEQAKPEGSWNPLVHTGKTIKDLASGIKQLVGDRDNEFSRDVQADRDVYEQYDQPIAAQLAGEALLIAPELATVPTAIMAATTGASRLASKAGAKKLGRYLSEQRMGLELAHNQRMGAPAGLPGAAKGAAYGGAMHVDPESDSYISNKMGNALMGAGFGGAADFVGTGIQQRFSKFQVARKRNEVSGSLEVPVRLSGPDLWNDTLAAQRAQTIINSKATDDWSAGDSTRQLYATSKKNAESDIAENAELIRAQATNSTGPRRKGEQLDSIITQLKTDRDTASTAASEKLDNFLSSNDKVFINDKFTNKMADDFKQYLSLRVDPSNRGSQINKLSDLADTLKNRSNAGIVNAKDIVKLQRAVTNIVSDTNPNSTSGKAAAKLKKIISGEVDEMVPGIKYGDDMYSPNGNEVVDNFFDALDSSNNYNASFNANPIIQQASKGELSANEFSDSLFGATRVLDSKDKIDAVNMLAANPTNKKDLAGELLQQTYSGQGSSGKDFNIDKFLDQYGAAVDTGSAAPLYKSLLDNKSAKQLDDLYNVANKHRNTKSPDNISGIRDTGFYRQFMSGAFVPGMTDVLANTPIIKQFGGKSFDEYMRAIRYQTGKRGALSNTKGAGKLGGITGADYEYEGSPIQWFLDTAVPKAYKDLVE